MVGKNCMINNMIVCEEKISKKISWNGTKWIHASHLQGGGRRDTNKGMMI